MMDRRDLFRILAAAAASGANAAPDDYKPRFFSPREYEVVDQLTELLIPADSESPGAHAAGVPCYIDTVLFHADSKTQAVWKTGLASLGDRRDYPALVAEMSASEHGVSSEPGHFFGMLKAIAIPAFALSDIGMRYLGYAGDRMRDEFPGCTHPEHRS